MSFEQFVNGIGRTTLNGAINNSTTSIVVVSAGAFPSIAQFRIRIDDELMLVTGISGTTLTVVRGIESSTAVSHTSGTNVDWTLTGGALDKFRADNVQYGADASLPSSNCKEGMVYIANDSPFIYRHNGSSWDTFGPNWRMKPPILSQFTGSNLSTTVIDTSHGFLRMSPPVNASEQLRAYWKTAPATPYRVAIVGYMAENFSEVWGFGIGVKDSVSGKIVSWGPFYYNSGTVLKADLSKWNTETSYSADYFALLAQLWDVPYFNLSRIWWAIRDDGSNRHFEFSFDGYNYLQYGVTGRTDWCTPDQVGFYVLQGNATNAPELSLMHWEP